MVQIGLPPIPTDCDSVPTFISGETNMKRLSSQIKKTKRVNLNISCSIFPKQLFGINLEPLKFGQKKKTTFMCRWEKESVASAINETKVIIQTSMGSYIIVYYTMFCSMPLKHLVIPLFHILTWLISFRSITYNVGRA